MDDKELTQAAFKEAENSLRDKQKQLAKDVVLRTLEKLDKIRKELKEKQEEERILKMDLDDLKEGKIDRIVERQEADPKAKEVSVVIIIKEKEVIHEHHHHNDYWHWPYVIQWQQPYMPVYYMPVQPSVTIQGEDISNSLMGESMSTTTSTQWYSSSSNCDSLTISCSAAKDASIGAYSVGDHIVHLR